MSLNDFLKTRPNLILDILIRFQWHVVAVIADIEKAFLMVEIKPSDRDMLCIVLLKFPYDVESEVSEFRFTCIIFGFWPSPAILGYVISYHLDQYQSRHPKMIQSIKTRFTLMTLYQVRYS